MAILDNKILAIEGGYDNDLLDAGGETKYGISLRSYPHLDIKNLTKEQALEIYKRDFWDKNRLGEINTQALANVIFYLIVNVGAGRGVKIVQAALNKYGRDLVIDGDLGAKTITALNTVDSIAAIDSIRVQTCLFYLAIVDYKPPQIKFLHGWIKRAIVN